MQQQNEQSCECDKALNTICKPCAARDRAVWQAGYDARLSPDLAKHINPYDPFEQSALTGTWLAGYMAAHFVLSEEK